MEEEDSTIPMNLDLNLIPVDGALAPRSNPIALMNLEEWLQDPRHRNQNGPPSWRRIPTPQETRTLSLEELVCQQSQAAKAYETSDGPSKDEVPDKNKEGEKDILDEGSYFDCNICLDLAKEPVVTCCGHLFCWPCIYRWLQHHSKAKECPVCKGEVTTRKVTPIYGNDFHTLEPSRGIVKIPPRPQAHRIESWRQSVQRTAFSIPMEEMIRRLGASSDSRRESVLQQPSSLNPNAPSLESPEMTSSLLNRLMTNRGLRMDSSPIVAFDEASDTTDMSPRNFEPRAGSHRFPPSLLQRSNADRVNDSPSVNLSSDEVLASDRSLEFYFENSPLFERYQDLSLPVDDRNSMLPSIAAAVMLSESLAVDNSSTLGQRSSLSSRRRSDSSRVLDFDGGDSRPSRRRRLY